MTASVLRRHTGHFSLRRHGHRHTRVRPTGRTSAAGAAPVVELPKLILFGKCSLMSV